MFQFKIKKKQTQNKIKFTQKLTLAHSISKFIPYINPKFHRKISV